MQVAPLAMVDNIVAFRGAISGANMSAKGKRKRPDKRSDRLLTLTNAGVSIQYAPIKERTEMKTLTLRLVDGV